ncbi:uncharacterized protein [Branchiostoma lanceolatum]|uniref:uncharacterized protein isoform X1 n=1 Tax=Branchiostoma lanceolatum TaxID=7740 RepID=UPI0034571620
MSKIIVEPDNQASEAGVSSGGKGKSTPRTDPNEEEEQFSERHANGEQDSNDVDVSNKMAELQVDDECFTAEEGPSKCVSLEENNGGKQTTGDPGSLPDKGDQDVVKESRRRDNVVMAEEKTSRLLEDSQKNDVVRLDDPGNLRNVKQDKPEQNDSTGTDNEEAIAGTTPNLHNEDSSANGNDCNRTVSQSSEVDEAFAADESASDHNSHLLEEEGSKVEGATAKNKPTSLEGASASEPKRPDSIPLVNSIDLYRRLHDPLSGMRTEGKKEEEKGAAGGSWGLAQQGFVSREGDMVSFVATDLTQKIKKSTPNRQTNESDPELELILGQKEHMAAASETVASRKATDMPPIDPRVLVHLERQAKQVSESLEIMMGNLRGTLHSMSAITVGCMQTHRDMVESLGDTTDLCVKAMYTLIARCEELNNSMKPVHEIAQQIKDIKKQLEAFEALCK